MAWAEALVRWNHPERGFISPGEFIPVFEKDGFITKMDGFVWKQTCASFGNWKKKGYPSLLVSVNVSRADFYQRDLVSVLLNLVGKYGISPRELYLEVTESAYTENPEQILCTVNELRKLGFIIEMDDFSLQSPCHPMNLRKCCRSFVKKKKR